MCVAWFFLPQRAAAGTRVPAVAMAHGVGAVKEMYIDFFAQRFAEAGIAALLFDYRFFGASGGEPRQRVFPRDQLEDYRSALTWLSMQPEIESDQLGVWGTSFSGGHVIHVAAYDPRVKAVASQVGAMDPGQTLRDQTTPEQFAAFQQMLVKERVRHATDGGEVYIPSAAPPGQGFALQNDQDSYNFGHEAQTTIAPMQLSTHLMTRERILRRTTLRNNSAIELLDRDSLWGEHCALVRRTIWRDGGSLLMKPDRHPTWC